MIGEERHDVAALSKHIFRESLQCFLWADLNKNPCACRIKCSQSFDELNRSRDLPRENVQHLRHNISTHRIKLAIHVRYDWNLRRAQMQTFQFLSERFTSARHNRGVKCMTHRK